MNASACSSFSSLSLGSLSDLRTDTPFNNNNNNHGFKMETVQGTNGYHDNVGDGESGNTYENIKRSSADHSRRSSQDSNTSVPSQMSIALSQLDQVIEKETNLGDDSSLRLRGGQQLLEESGTELSKSSLYRVDSKEFSDTISPLTAIPARLQVPKSTSVTGQSNGTGTAKSRASRSPYSAPSLESVPIEEVTIPGSGNISGFSCDQLANFLRCLNVEDRIISHLHRKKVDGKRFSRLRDSELETLGMKNPVVLFFREKSCVKKANMKGHFLL